jgi:hypothetical protein
LGPGFSSVANTPMRRHKTWVHEGGISTPLIACGSAAVAALRTVLIPARLDNTAKWLDTELQLKDRLQLTLMFFFFFFSKSQIFFYLLWGH